LVCNDQQGVYTKDLKVRRLLPIECERLQGYPDNWTLDVSDTQRYRQMGNSISTVIPEFIARNLILKESI
jgi:DNA (cytosine-5)-methyltransferase 1